MVIEPKTEEDVAEAVREALAAKIPLEILGGGSKQTLGRPVQAERTLSMKGLSGITLYEPAEMVIGGWAGTPLSLLQQTLDLAGQMLAFEPPDLRGLLGTNGEPTIGGLVATGLAGPRRIVAGGLRDSLIGIRFVNGRGEIIKNGGRVMKNVTGLDLVKLQAGAYGTLGVLTEVIFKVIPKPPTQATLRFAGLDDERGIAAMGKAFGSAFEPTGGAHLPASGGETFIRIEGFPEQISYRSAALSKLLKEYGPMTLLEGDQHDALWREIRDAVPLAASAGETVWRLSLPSTRAATLVKTLKATHRFRHFYDWAGGLVWLVLPEGQPDNGAIQKAVAAAGGYATLFRGSEAIRASATVFQPLDPAVMKLQSGLKASFDPAGILNPGRMYAGV